MAKRKRDDDEAYFSPFNEGEVHLQKLIEEQEKETDPVKKERLEKKIEKQILRNLMEDEND